jgi:hypothetical protein
VVDNNIYRWAGMLLSEAGKLVEAGPREKTALEKHYPEPEGDHLMGVG